MVAADVCGGVDGVDDASERNRGSLNPNRGRLNIYPVQVKDEVKCTT